MPKIIITYLRKRIIVVAIFNDRKNISRMVK